MAKLDVAVSEEMAKLSVRAKEAETRAKAARDETKADLETGRRGSARIVSGTSREAAREGRRKQGEDLCRVGTRAADMERAHRQDPRGHREQKNGARLGQGREERRARRTRRIVRDRIRVWGNRGGRVCGARRGPCEDGCRRGVGGSGRISHVRRHRRAQGRCRVYERPPCQPDHHQYPDSQDGPLLVGGVAARRVLVGHRGGRAEVQPRVGGHGRCADRSHVSHLRCRGVRAGRLGPRRHQVAMGILWGSAGGGRESSR